MNNGTTNTVYSTEIGYTTRTVSGESITGTQIGSYTSSINGSAIDSLGYEYDGNGNITRIYKVSTGATVCSYQYDILNRLTRENNADLEETYVYSYDNGGNIRSKKTYAYTTGTLTGVTPTQTDTYDYGMDTGEPDPEDWNDRLWGYNGVEISYDDSGNPLSYYNGSSYTFTWTQGRRLATATTGGKALSFTYNESGIRTSKIVDGVKHEYVVDGTKIISDSWTENNIKHLVTYIYDAKGVIGMAYRNSSMSAGVFEYYIFEKNLQGDIVAVYDEYGFAAVTYTYDAWGNVSEYVYDTTSNGQYNSFRYRGYFYDEDTELYYLNSRYYDPATGRFLNADVIIPGTSGELNGYNLYAYCFNNPVNMTDSDGNWPEWIDNVITWVDENIVEPIKHFVEDVREDIDEYDENNESEEKVFSSNYFSNYKGALVIKTPLDASFSFGFIGLSKQQQNSETLKHEYGHTIQMQNMGVGKYVKDVAIPSVMINVLDRKDKLPYDYYSYPWEAEANKLGGSTLSDGKPPLPQDGYNSYWDLIKLFFE